MRSVAIVAVVMSAGGCNDLGPGQPPAPLRSAAVRGPEWFTEVPQLDDLERLFGASEPQVAARYRGVLACRVEVVFDATDMSPPDLGVRLVVGTAAQGDVRTPQSNAWDGIVAWPGVELVVGQQVAVTLWDEDFLTRSDLLGTLEARFTGAFPIVLRDRHTSAECRPIDAARLVDSLDEARVRGLAALDMLAQLPPPDVASGRLERGDELVNEARGALREMAAILGWDDPALRAAIAREQALERAWSEQLRAHLDGLVASLPPPGTAVPIPAAGVTLAASLDCDPARGHCRVTYDLAPLPGAGPVHLPGRLRTQLVTREGLAINPGSPELDERTTAIDGHVRVTFGVHVAARYQPTLHLARVTVYGQPTRAVRVR